MDFKTLELTDKDAITGLFKDWGYENAESSFANLFIWRKYMNLKFCISNNAVCLLLERNGKQIAFVPINAPSEPIERHMLAIMDYFSQNRLEFTAFCTEFQRERLSQTSLYEKLAFKEIIRSNEYIYDAESLRTLSGKAYQKKRNHINNIMKNFGGRFEYQPLKPSHADECLELYDAWLETSAQDDYMEFERSSVADALTSFEYLDLQGAIIRINGKLEAFTLGERLSRDTALIHIEKANRDIVGLYPLINQSFLSSAFPDVLYVNREEDLGLEGLRKAKMSYYPIRFIRKYGVSFK